MNTRIAHPPQALLAALALSVPAVGQLATQRVSLGAGGVEGDNHASELPRNRPSLSGDARFVAFESTASNLVAGDTNGVSDIFVHDRASGSTTRVSVSSAGVQANAQSSSPDITPDGRFVLFTSSATNLTPGIANNSEDVFLHDRSSGETTLISVALGGVAAAGLCWFDSFSSNYRRPLSADGRFVAFASGATNIVAGDTNGTPDVFMRDRLSGTTVRVSVDALGAQVAGTSSTPSMTPDGRYVAFQSNAALVAADTNGFGDVYVKDLVTGAVTRVSTSAAGVQASGSSSDASISSDGRWVAFQSFANNLVAGDTNGVGEPFVKDLASGAIVRINLRFDGTQATLSGEAPMLSRDGRFAAFWSWDPFLTTGDTNNTVDVFVRDLALGTTRRVSLSASGSSASWPCYHPDLTSDGLVVSFASLAPDLVAGDTNFKYDVFVRELAVAAPVVFCTAKVNSAGCTPRIHAVGAPTVGAGSFTIGATQVLNHKSGVLFYGYSATALPYVGGARCATAPLRRTPVQTSGGNPPPDDCSGAYTFDMRAWILSGADPALSIGATVVAQYWSRDASSSFGAGLTDAVAFVVAP